MTDNKDAARHLAVLLQECVNDRLIDILLPHDAAGVALALLARGVTGDGERPARDPSDDFSSIGRELLEHGRVRGAVDGVGERPPEPSEREVIRRLATRLGWMYLPFSNVEELAVFIEELRSLSGERVPAVPQTDDVHELLGEILGRAEDILANEATLSATSAGLLEHIVDFAKRARATFGARRAGEEKPT